MEVKVEVNIIELWTLPMQTNFVQKLLWTKKSYTDESGAMQKLKKKCVRRILPAKELFFCAFHQMDALNR